jgi:3-isopropylmalate/(R)-2-methylmalate dehydratase large subunit
VTTSGPRTLLEKIWDAHLVRPATPATPAILYIDLHLVHEVTSPQAFTVLRERGLAVRRPDRTVATMDHSTPTTGPVGGRYVVSDPQAAAQLAALESNCRDFGVTLHGLGSPSQGVIHVIGPELGLTQPGMTVVAGDSHTSTHGAFGALAFGIGTSAVSHVLATQCLLVEKPRSLAIDVTGGLGKGVTAKDLVLAIIAKIGAGGAAGHVVEYRGEAIRGLGMEERMTLCNMTIEAGGRAGLVAPDDVTFGYLTGRPHAPKDEAWEAAVCRWKDLPSDEGAVFDSHVTVDASLVEPWITWGTTPAMGVPIGGRVPRSDGTATYEKALRYMGLEAEAPMLGRPVDVVFIGSCTNGRIVDLRMAASVLKGRRVAAGVRAVVVPGSQQVKRQAQAEGLDRIFLEAGAEWREPGCSMCIAMNGDRLEPGQYAVSTSNRNFEGRQGPGGRTFLASPLTAAAAAVRGCVADARELLG